MVSRRAFLFSSAAAISVRGAASMTSKERVDRVLAGREPDCAPFTFWYHFRDEAAPGAQHAKSTLDFHRRIGTDLVKVMSDYPFPKPSGEWFDLKVVDNPFPRQIEALQAIGDGLKGEAYFVETIFNPYNVAEKLSSKEAVEKMRKDNPKRLLDALDVIARSEANHARRAIEVGASGVFLAIANSAEPEYARFSEPFDKIVMQAVSSARLNVLHIHGDKIDLPRFYSGWPAAAINYSVHGTHIPFAEARRHWNGVLLGGLDENNFRTLTASQAKTQADTARKQAGTKLILAGGCSVPNETTDDELLRAIRALAA